MQLLAQSQRIVGLLILLLIWETATRVLHPRPVILPSPEAVFYRVFALLKTSEIWENLAISIQRVLIGFGAGTISGILVAVVLARFPFVNRSVRSVLVTMRFVIPFAWVPIAAYWFGLSEIGKLFITWYASFFIIVFQVRAGLETVPELYVKVAQTFGMSERRILWHVVLPAAWPSIVVGMRLGLSLSWVAILAAEMVNANSGIGYFINYSGQLLATDQVMAGMIMIGVLGFCTDQAIAMIGKWVLPGTEIAA
jgi:ABC-type nitrate/sulfonate/bicarbonate transport system permease component